MPKRSPQLKVEIVSVPDADGEAALDALLDMLADGLAGVYIKRARAEVAAKLGHAQPGPVEDSIPNTMEDEALRRLQGGELRAFAPAARSRKRRDQG